MENFEKLGAFYLGKLYDQSAGKVLDDLLLYDAKDLTTHAVCVGMTGSGKTGLCLSLLEEAAIDGVPAIAIDPKGDLGNLLLSFPQLRPQDFRPWVDPGEAARKGMNVDEYAADRAKLWKKGLASWGQDGARIAKFRSSVDISIYTPGSTAGLPISVLRSFDAPSPALMADQEALRDRVSSAVSGLLALLGVDADPLRSREHILVSTIIDQAWRAGQSLDIPSLIQAIQAPSFSSIGVLDLESFFPSRDRFGLAMLLNNLLASPSFATWMQGEPLDIGRLLYTPEGRPRISILSIAHLPESERMFFVTILLNELVAWMRGQSGTSSLRALLYMDEIFGFFPPTANPPSKKPMLTLLKQARAYGLGVVLATQNPVDLDYKGLSNTGTWFLGRLQTERDKMRVLEGLEGASATAGSTFDRQKMEATLAGLGSRVFLMNNVHDDAPALFHTRWALSYLRGPLTRTQIQTLMADRVAAAAAASPPSAPPAHAFTPPAAPAAAPYAAAPYGAAPYGAQSAPAYGAVPMPAAAVAPVPAPVPAAPARVAPPPRPTLPADIEQRFLSIDGRMGGGDRLVYRPGLLGTVRLHYARTSAKIDEWDDVCLLTRLEEDASGSDLWESAIRLAEEPGFDRKPDGAASYSPVPRAASKKTSYRSWNKALKDHLYQNRRRIVLRCRELKQYSKLGESERDFRIRLREHVHEKRDVALEKLRKRYTPKLKTLQDRLRRAEEKVDREKAQFKQAGFGTAISMGTTVLGALFGRKTMSVGTVGRAGSAAKSMGRTAREKGDIGRAEENVEVTRQRLAEMEAEFQEETDRLREEADVDTLDFEEIVIAPRKSDINIERFSLVWAPYRIGQDGIAEPVFDATTVEEDA